MPGRGAADAPEASVAPYDDAVTIEQDLDRARHLAFAADEGAAKDLLLSLMPRIEQVDRDDLMLEVYAQLGEIYLIRTAYDGVTECLTRMRDCLRHYTATPPADAPVGHMIRRYRRRVLFLQTGLAAAHGDHESAALSLQALIGDATTADDLRDEHDYLITHARILCAVALCDDDLHVQSLPLWQEVLDVISGPGDATLFSDALLVLGGTGYGRFCVETGRLTEAEPWLRRAGARARPGRRGDPGRGRARDGDAVVAAHDGGLPPILRRPK